MCSFFVPINASLVRTHIKDQLVANLLSYRTGTLLMPFEPVIDQLVWDIYPVAHAYRHLLGHPAPDSYIPYANRISPNERTTRDGYHAAPFVFWSRIAATVQSWKPIPRNLDGILEANEQLHTSCVELLTSAPLEEAIETWLLTVAEWLHCCNVNEISEQQASSSNIRVPGKESHPTSQLAQHMRALVEYSFLH